MKKFILVIALFNISLCSSFGSHLIGGEITSRNIGGLTYEVALTQCYDGTWSGINIITGFNYSDSSGAWSVFHPAYSAGMKDSTHLFHSWLFIDTITFPNSGFYNIYFNECCRGPFVSNITNSSLYLSNIIYADSSNSSSYFMNYPIFIAQLGDTFNYNPLGYDPDGDSLVYSVDTPLVSLGVGDAGYTAIPSDPTMPYSINSQTGQMTFIPTMQGFFQYMILVKEYRQGVLIGSIEREVPLLVLPSPNLPVVTHSISNTSPFTGQQFDIQVGDTFKLNMLAYDPNNITINMSASGEPMLLASPSSFNAYSVSGNAQGKFIWTPSFADVRNKPYLVTIRVSEEFAPYIFERDATFILTVKSLTAIPDNIKQELTFNISPNPTTSHFTITPSVFIDQIEITDVIGQLVYRAKPKDKKAEINIERAGIYFVTISTGQERVTRKVVVQK